MMMSDVSWSDLPEDLLILIARKLHFIKDKVLFRSVCVSWRSASKAVTSLDGTCRLPCLLLAKRETKFHLHNKYLCDFTQNRTTELSYKCGSRRCDEKWYLGWKGWILVVDRYGVMCLRHAFKNTTPISLPMYLKEGAKTTVVSKAVLSSDPFMNAFDYTLAIVYGHLDQLALWRPGDKSYSRIQGTGILDAIFHGGLLYVTSLSSMFVFDVGRSSPLTAYQLPEKIPHTYYYYTIKRYLVEVGGDMVLIDLEESFGFGYSLNLRFKVFLVSEFHEWKEVKDLGNIAIFIGTNSQSFALDNASEVQGCKPNHIYITSVGSKWKRNAGVYAYNLANAEVDFDYAACEEDFRCFKPLWVQPVFD